MAVSDLLTVSEPEEDILNEQIVRHSSQISKGFITINTWTTNMASGLVLVRPPGGSGQERTPPRSLI